ncbi:MAG: glycosyltransferase family 2 protein [Paracoccus sp. (in: a-proteobacteria)]
MTLPATSVIVVSRGRPAHLRLCLAALGMQDHPEFEIILVADAEGLAQCPDLPAKRVAYDVPNISEARNLGIAEAAGEVIAFIDDDAVAEPGWLSRLSAPFANPEVLAATGWTRDRNGFSWQQRSQRIHRNSWCHTIPSIGPEVQLLPPENGRPVSTLGTNCAFRTSALRQIGGFDSAFAFHLDESDVNLRMADVFPEALTAIVPGAEVIHAQAGSERRKQNRVPQDLTLEGRSTSLFTRRHGRPVPISEALRRKRRRLLRHMLDGQLDPFQLAPVLASLQKGLTEGARTPLPDPPPPREDNPSPFLPASARPGPLLVLGGWHWQAAALRRRAARAMAEGHIVTLILFTPTFVSHRVQMTEAGWFEQTGGLWGASAPGDLPAKFWRLKARLTRETKMIHSRRNLSHSPAVSA